MIISDLVIQNFRSYPQYHLKLSDVTVIVGPNTAGKSNLIEALFLLSSGKSFRAEKDFQMVRFGQEIGRVKGKIKDTDVILIRQLAEKDLISKKERRDSSPASRDQNDNILEVVVAKINNSYSKRFFVNNVARRRVDFMEHFHALLFAPTHLDIVSGSPSIRRRFLDEVLESVDRDYRQASIQYEKVLRQRNALLHVVRETGKRDPKVFEYWDNLLITNGQILTKKREEFIELFNSAEKDLIQFVIEYDKSIVSGARLEQYLRAEEASAVTLVGPHRDDFLIRIYSNENNPPAGKAGSDASEIQDAKFFGSRGQQRLVVLQLKLLQLTYMERVLGHRPVLLLDDIFSELDDHHIEVVMGIADKQQTIITTAHEEFIQNKTKDAAVIELEKND